MNRQLIPWTIDIVQLATRLRCAGGASYPVQIDLSICALTPAFPSDISECMNYQPICAWLLDELPCQAPQLALQALYRFVFGFDARITSLALTVATPPALAEARGGISRTTRSRCQHEDEASGPDLFQETREAGDRARF